MSSSMVYGNPRIRLHLAFRPSLQRRALVEALKAQLRFRKNLLRQTPVNKSVFVFSEKMADGKRRYLSVEEFNIHCLTDLSRCKYTIHKSGVRREMLDGDKILY